MAPKALLTFVSVGMVSGLALGLYLADARDLYSGAMHVSMVDGPSISVIPAKALFEGSEPVTFRMINTGTEPLYSHDGMYGATITGLSGIVMYAFDAPDDAGGQDGPVVSGAVLRKADVAMNPFDTDETAGSVQARDYDRGVLLPGLEILISWNQTKHDGEMLQAGLYKINAQAHVGRDGTGPVITSSATFTIQ